VNTLAGLEGYVSERAQLAPGPEFRTAAPVLIPNAARLNRRARDFDLLHTHGEVASLFMLPSLARMPAIVTIHGLNLLRRMHGARRGLALRNLRAITGLADRVVCISHSEHADVAEAVGPSLADRLVVIRNGVATAVAAGTNDGAALRRDLELPPDVTVALFAGGLDDVKEPLVAARAAVEARRRGGNLVLLIAGEGPLRAAAAAEAGDAVRLLGHRSDLPALNALADLFVLPSRREGLSYALLDAMSYAAVPVASDVPGNAEAVGDAGVLVPVGDVSAFAEALVTLAGDGAARERLAAKARQRVETEFPLDAMMERTRALYDEVLGQPG